MSLRSLRFLSLRLDGSHFFLLFLICCLQYCFIQLVLPYLLPNLFEVDGLLKVSSDSIYFHKLALSKALQLKELGWSAWELRPRNSAVVGISSILYYFIPSLGMTIPLCAMFATLAAISLGKIIQELNFSDKAATWVSFLLVLHPISLQWNSQHHKDTYTVLGIILIMLGYIRLFKTNSVKDALLNSVKFIFPGIGLIWLMRPFLIEVMTMAFVSSFVLTILFQFKKAGRSLLPLLLVTVPMGSIFLFSGDKLMNKPYMNRSGNPVGWETTAYVPRLLDAKLHSLAKNRRAIIIENRKSNTTLTTGEDLKNSIEVLLFLPQSFLDSIIEPLPFLYTHRTQGDGSFIISIVAGFDMILSYFLLIFFFIYLFMNRSQVIIFNVSCVLFILLTVFAFSFPNIGTLYRMRYPFYIILVAIGFSHLFDSKCPFGKPV